MNGIESVDEQLFAATDRREELVDILVRTLVEIDAETEHIAELIDQRLSA